MGFQANVLKIMIASPGDVAVERSIVTDELYRWNDANAVSRGLMLHPVKWETHSSPQMGAHPQTILNERLLRDADIVVGVFGTRVGTATPDYISGSVEEIKRHVAAGKLAMLYFSHVPVDPSSIDQTQWAALQQFKEECKAGGLYSEYATHEEFRAGFGQHLAIELNKPQYLWLIRPDEHVAPRDPELGDNEKSLLIAAASDQNGYVMTGSAMGGGGFFVQANNTNFVDGSPRSEASWKHVLKRLAAAGYLEETSQGLYNVTDEGFARADKEIAAVPLEVSLSFVGAPDKQMLSVVANRSIIPEKLDFLMASEVYITSMDLDETTAGSTIVIPLDPQKAVELFNAPRPDKNHWDNAGPAALRLVFTWNGRRSEAVLPVLLKPVFINNTQWIKLSGSKTFTLT
jgi:hypothetical protein